MTENEFGQPVGRELAWIPARSPQARTFVGVDVTLEPLTLEHASGLMEALGHNPESWTYLPSEPPKTVADMETIIKELRELPDALSFAVRDTQGNAVGMLSYIRDQPAIGLIEVGYVAFGPALQRTRASTEAHYLLMRHVFDDLGYRRYEWKCDSLNAPSRTAAARLGFVEEGTWRNALIVKGRNRDTTWFSIIIEEWPKVKAAFESWLAPDNFEDGRQLRSLSSFR